MGQPLTVSEVLEAGLPASSEGELYRYEPSKGFFRMTTTRFAPGWLPLRWPAYGDRVLWYHDEGCDCRFCCPQPAVQAAPEEGLVQIA